MRLYYVFSYDYKNNFRAMRIVSELSWEKISDTYLKRLSSSNQINECILIEERELSDLDVNEMSLLDDIIFINKEGREGDIREFIVMRLAGI